ncbi:hypothetical protein PCE1_001256 [Barthelona sp. PCE]
MKLKLSLAHDHYTKTRNPPVLPEDIGLGLGVKLVVLASKDAITATEDDGFLADLSPNSQVIIKTYRILFSRPGSQKERCFLINNYQGWPALSVLNEHQHFKLRDRVSKIPVDLFQPVVNFLGVFQADDPEVQKDILYSFVVKPTPYLLANNRHISNDNCYQIAESNLQEAERLAISHVDDQQKQLQNKEMQRKMDQERFIESLQGQSNRRRRDNDHSYKSPKREEMVVKHTSTVSVSPKEPERKRQFVADFVLEEAQDPETSPELTDLFSFHPPKNPNHRQRHLPRLSQPDTPKKVIAPTPPVLRGCWTPSPPLLSAYSY